MKIRPGAARIFSVLFANFGSDEIVSAKTQRLWVDRDQSPRDEDKPSPADFLFG